jgi:hypothetical protein
LRRWKLSTQIYLRISAVSRFHLRNSDSISATITAGQTGFCGDAEMRR